MQIKVRFAPSPTGVLHVGNCRTALINWLFARKNNGVFMLRMDDTDLERSQEHYAEQIRKDLKWLGLEWDTEAKQSERFKRYEEQATYLKNIGRLYPCYETPEELEFKRKRALGRGLPPIYDREALKLSAAERGQFESQGRRPHWRFKLNNSPVQWIDMVRGPVHFDGEKLSDPVLVREDGSPVYTLASVIDDMDMGITHVVRGEDHVANTAIQIQLLEALGANPALFHFAHTPLITDAEGSGLSKRIGSLGVKDLKTGGILPMALNSLLARLGTSDPIEPCVDFGPLIESFDFSKFARGAPKFSLEELASINTKLIHHMTFDEIKRHLPSDLAMSNDFWEAVKGNLITLQDLTFWVDLVDGRIKTITKHEDKDFIQEVIDSLKEHKGSAISAWFETFRASSSRKGKGFFMPLRLALTGEDHGPELPKILTLMGHKKALKQLEQSLI